MSNVINKLQATQRRALGARRVPIPRACSIAMRSVIARIKTRAHALTQHPSTMSWRFRQVIVHVQFIAMTAPACVAQSREFIERRSIGSVDAISPPLSAGSIGGLLVTADEQRDRYTDETRYALTSSDFSGIDESEGLSARHDTAKRRVNLGIEQPSDVRLQKLDRLLRLHRFPVGPLRGERVECVGRCEDTAPYRNPLGVEATRISRAVPMLVVILNERECFTQVLERCQDFHTDTDVLFDVIELFRR